MFSSVNLIYDNIIPLYGNVRKRKKKNLTKKLSIFNAYEIFAYEKVFKIRVEDDIETDAQYMRGERQ